MVTSRLSNLSAITVTPLNGDYNVFSLEPLRLPKPDVYARKTPKEGYISLPVCCKKNISVAWKDITYLEATSNYTKFYFSNGKNLLVSRTMKDFLSKLDAEMFVRVHKSFAINLNYLVHFDVKEDMYVQLKDGAKISVSRRKKKEFLEKKRQYLGQ
ncbi:LytR/AlgR family response regulator transcription factor [Flectobacillus major]|uniref:LytR/AlgR family response regulator transcription factor n=1 Tax=Flectobacillus major TaxID=103 RepID=UPI00069480A1|nr:LytTR family DNA-binding domain-containing protein [Flectobacillus major]